MRNWLLPCITNRGLRIIMLEILKFITPKIQMLPRWWIEYAYRGCKRLKKRTNALKPEERKTVDKYFREKVLNPVSIAKSNLEKSKKAKDTFMAKVPSTMIMKEKSAPKEAFILNRGEYDQPTEKFLGHYPLFYLLYRRVHRMID